MLNMLGIRTGRYRSHHDGHWEKRYGCAWWCRVGHHRVVSGFDHGLDARRERTRETPLRLKGVSGSPTVYR